MKREFDLVIQARNAFGLLATMLAVLVAWFGVGLFLSATVDRPDVSARQTETDFEKALEVYETFAELEIAPPESMLELLEAAADCSLGVGVDFFEIRDAQLLYVLPLTDEICEQEETLAALAVNEATRFSVSVRAQNSGTHTAVGVRLRDVPAGWERTDCRFGEATEPEGELEPLDLEPGQFLLVCFAVPSTDPNLRGFATLYGPSRERVPFKGDSGVYVQPFLPYNAIETTLGVVYDEQSSRAQDFRTAQRWGYVALFVWALFLVVYYGHWAWTVRPNRDRFTYSDHEHRGDTSQDTQDTEHANAPENDP